MELVKQLLGTLDIAVSRTLVAENCRRRAVAFAPGKFPDGVAIIRKRFTSLLFAGCTANRLAGKNHNAAQPANPTYHPVDLVAVLTGLRRRG